MKENKIANENVWKEKKLYLYHTNTGSNIDQKIREQIIVVNLHKFLMTFQVCESFMTDSLLKKLSVFKILVNRRILTDM